MDRDASHVPYRPQKQPRLHPSTRSWQNKSKPSIGSHFSGSESEFLRRQYGMRVSVGQVLQHRLRSSGTVELVTSSQALGGMTSIAGLNNGVFAATMVYSEHATVVDGNGKLHYLEAAGSRVVSPRLCPDRVAVLGGKAQCCVFDVNQLDTPISEAQTDGPFRSDADISSDGSTVLVAFGTKECPSRVSLFDLRVNSKVPSQVFDASSSACCDGNTYVRMLYGTAEKFVLHASDGNCHIFDGRINGNMSEVHAFSVTGAVEPPRWCVRTNSWIPANVLHSEPICSMSSLGDGDRILTNSGADGHRLWSCSSGRMLEHFSRTNGMFTAVVPPAELGPVTSFYCANRIMTAIEEWSLNDPTQPVASARDTSRLFTVTCAAITGGLGMDGLLIGTGLGAVHKWTCSTL